MVQSKCSVGPCVLVIFGASGDLTRRKLLPALFRLEKKKLVPEHYKILGIARTPKSREQFQKETKNHLKAFMPHSGFDERTWKKFQPRLFYQEGSISDMNSLQKLKKYLLSFLKADRHFQLLFYFALPPSVIEHGLQTIKDTGLLSEFKGVSRAMIEKPFGRDLLSAQKLDALLQDLFSESRVYRIDHYLAKDTVRNLMVLRFANTIFEPLWNRFYIDNIQITAAEKIGIEGRCEYYEESGVVRDMLQNHVMQLLALTTMEPPLAEHAESVRNKKVEVFQSILPIQTDQYVLGQYQGYREEPNVDSSSATPTYVALKVYIYNWRWQGVPFYIRSGKSLKEKVSEIIVQFKTVPLCVLGKNVCQHAQPNVLIIRIQPDEGIRLGFSTRVPGLEEKISQANLDFRYADLGTPPSGGYEGVLLDGI